MFLQQIKGYRAGGRESVGGQGFQNEPSNKQMKDQQQEIYVIKLQGDGSKES